MWLRRKRLVSLLRGNERALTIPAFPRFGVGEFTEPPYAARALERSAATAGWPLTFPCPSLYRYAPNGPVATSDGVPDEVISPIPRFATLTRNIRTRCGEKVRIRVPLWEDERTDPAELAKGIEMDAMAYGMGCSCLQARRTPHAQRSREQPAHSHSPRPVARRLAQVTFQARDLAESRHLYDLSLIHI